jgi:hypothetical protein
MNIEDLSVKLGVNVSANILHPAPGDLLVLKVESFLSSAQRDAIETKVKPLFAEFACKFLVLEGGSDVLLIKKPAAAPAEQGNEQVGKGGLRTDEAARSAFYERQASDLKDKDASA